MCTYAQPVLVLDDQLFHLPTWQHRDYPGQVDIFRRMTSNQNIYLLCRLQKSKPEARGVIIIELLIARTLWKQNAFVNGFRATSY